MNRKVSFLSLVLINIMLYSFVYVKVIEATGGAFPKVKHGGFATDGNTPCAGGVNRGLGVDYGGDCTQSIYREPGTVDIYKSGECTHCHELHASFGASENANGEPAPNTGGNAGPDRYLLMHEYGTTVTYAALCWYCHENFTIHPSKGWGQWGFFQGKDRYMDSSHFRSPAFKWPGPHPNDIESGTLIWPRRSRQYLADGNTGSCLNCHTPHGIRVPGLDEWAVSRSIQGEDPSGNYDFIIPRQLIAWEEGLCMRCHSQIGPADGWKDEFKYQGVREQFRNSTTKMPLVSPNLPKTDRHDRKKENVSNPAYPMVSQGWNPTGHRHVECYDCHNPHTIWDKKEYDDAGAHLEISGSHRHDPSYPHSNKASGVLRGIWGVSVTWPSYTKSSPNDISPYNWIEPDGANITYTVIDQVTKEYELCMKCHTYFAFGTNKPSDPNNPYGYTDESKEVNPNNAAYHPIVAPTGRTLSVRNIPSGSNPWKAPWRDNIGTQTMYCTDCHGADNGPASGDSADSSDMATGPGSSQKNQPRGPHGSNNPYILKGNWFVYNASSSVSITNSSLLCFKCHQQGSYGGGGGSAQASSFAKSSGGNLHDFHQGITENPLRCVRCHVQVPHGWRRRSLLVNMDGSGPEADGSYQNPKPEYRRYINNLGGRRGPMPLPSPANWAESNCNGVDWMSSYCEFG